MELWIRSQDREKLVRPNNLKIEYENELYVILSKCNYRYRLGYYKTKERALEVLDEIQRKIIASKRIECNRFYTEGSHRNHEAKIDIPYIEPIVYQMPLE